MMYTNPKTAKNIVIPTKMSNMLMIPNMGTEGIKRLNGPEKGLNELKKLWWEMLLKCLI